MQRAQKAQPENVVADPSRGIRRARDGKRKKCLQGYFQKKFLPLEGSENKTISETFNGVALHRRAVDPANKPQSFLDAVSVGVIQMSLMQETVLDRLWTKYEHRFGHPPPIASASFEEAISKIRMALDGRDAGSRAAFRHNEINNTGGMPIQAP